MSLVIGDNITQSFGPQVVLKDISFRLSGADRIGLVGPNGEGKTTFIRIMAGLLEPTLGKVHFSQGLRIGYLPQQPPPFENGTIHDAMLDVFADLRRREHELHEFAVKLAEDPDNADLLKCYGLMQSEFEALGGYSYPSRIEQVLTGLAFPRDIWDRPLAQLSGGQRTRVYLGTLLLREPDILLLDEPTNHLDLDSVEWLETWLGAFRGALVVVSHDRYFLDHVTNATWEIAFGRLETYPGSYTKYLDLRTQRHERRTKEWEAQQEYVEKTRDFIARHLAGQRTKEAQGRRTRLERFLRDEAIEKPRQQQTINFKLSAGRPTGEFVLRVENLRVGYESARPLVHTERLEVMRDQRIAIVGANGTGKTTLLRTLLGQLQPLTGSVRHGANVRIGYLSQIHSELDPDQTALDAVLAVDRNLLPERARGLLGSLLLSGDDVFKTIHQLSGGQRARVILARLMVLKSNVLMLDEPTNHLDIPSTEIMQETLQNFDGTIIFVSHDRYLVQAVATQIWAVDGGAIRVIDGTWEDYLRWRINRQNAVDLQKSSDRTEKEDSKTQYEQARKKANQLQRIKRRHEELETEIERIEAELANLNQQITAAGQAGNLDQIEKLGEKYQHRHAQLKDLWNEWEDLTDQLE